MLPNTPLSSISSITPYYLVRLKKLGIVTVRDFLFHFPHRYEDYSVIRKIGDLVPDERATICGTVSSFRSGRTFRKNMLLAEATITDESGSIRIIWFNQQFVAQTVKPGMEIRISGKVSADKKGILFSNPAFERAGRDVTHTGRLVPIYPETTGLTSKFFRWQIGDILKKNIHDIPDFIPEEILRRLHLPSLAHALAYIHFPKSEEETLVAQKRFAFDEMLLVQLKVLLTKSAWDTSSAIPFPRAEDTAISFIKSLPYELTSAQKRAATEILADLTQNKPMNRLLNGDVGSGKTAVAAIACGSVAEADHQSALLAPTEVLAKQHYETFTKLFQRTNTTVSLLTQAYQFLGGKPVARVTLLAALKAGMIDILIGTHAIIQKDIAFKNLSLIVVDEQHRFGVAQRAYLQQEAISLTRTDFTQTNAGPSALLHEDLSYKIRGAVFNVKKQLGLGHKESIYQKALAKELSKSAVSFDKEKSLDIRYGEKKIGTYRPDFIIDNKIIVELKALPTIGKFEKQQVWHYLKGSEYELAFLVNFGHRDVEFERIIHSSQHGSASRPHKSAPMVPHLLSMTATPIPRTLTLAYLGNLELSLLDEMPKARKPIITKIARNNADRNTIYEFIRKHIAEGRQAFVILPLVEESEALADVRAATVECERLKKDIFPDLSIGLLHGRLKSKEKESIMLGFKEKKYDILVATSVVEVGIDIPNATIILIEDADRFGLSQLHQFRGRVGRGIHQSYCFLFPGENGSAENARLKVLEKTNDGFEIAEEDLKLRGPGSFFGIRQSGLPDVAMENLANIKLVKISRTEAENLLKKDPKLEDYPLLQEELRRFEERIHLE